jgi:hypothetical protein
MYVGKPEGSCEKLGLVLNFCNSWSILIFVGISA